MGTIITIWFVAMGVYYVCAVGLCLVKKLPAALAFIVCLPVMPFIVARRNRKERPCMTKMIAWGWAIFYLLILLIWIIDGHL